MRQAVTGALVALAITTPSLAQAPRPVPGASSPPAQPGQAAAPAAAPGQSPAPQPGAGGVPAQPAAAITAPPATSVVFPIYPRSQFLASYDAGKGQRYYLYGTTDAYLDVVTYYRTQLRDRGDEVFEAPRTHMWQQRFREETMAFPPGVTVKDWTFQSGGYLNPRRGVQPERFGTVVMIVPPPPAQPATP